MCSFCIIEGGGSRGRGGLTARRRCGRLIPGCHCGGLLGVGVDLFFQLERRLP